jgi:hypothetical protein
VRPHLPRRRSSQVWSGRRCSPRWPIYQSGIGTS